MLFNSFVFLFAFLPLTFFVWRIFCRFKKTQAALFWLLAASLFFYGYWNPPYLLLLVASILVNCLLQRRIADLVARGRTASGKRILVLGIVLNLGAIAYYKYANFFLGSLDALFQQNWPMLDIFLPLGISFYTFQQIACLVDTFRGEVGPVSLTKYALFVSFFPQLVAGPIVLANRLIPQFEGRRIFVFSWQNVYQGLALFSLGLFKKVVIADRLSPQVSAVFNNLDSIASLSCGDAWTAVLAYTFQIYFDFSGYSDMALGLARLFNVDLPLNFNSPYKAASIIDFWRRWHMTLSRFLRDYLYIPLGGNRKGAARRYANLLATMLIGGLWHGAGWTFVLWGGLHGLFLCINHAWEKMSSFRLPRPAGIFLTFFSVTLAWVFFRAGSLDHALIILKSMCSVGQLHFPQLTDPMAIIAGKRTMTDTEILLGCTLVCFCLPNSMQIVHRLRDFAKGTLALVKTQGEVAAEVAATVRKRVRLRNCALLGISFCIGILLASSFLYLNSVSEFLYFQF